MRVFVTGASGQLGAAIVRAFGDREVVVHTRASLDVTDPESVGGAVARAEPDVVVNCAAFNDVDRAEDEPATALAVNAFAVRSLARAAEASGALLVHYGTDFVFDGAASEAYDEAVKPAPRSTYAASKLLGEWFALDAPRAFVLRVESLFGCPIDWRGRRGTLDSIVEGLECGREIKVFADRVVSPSYLEDVARATRFLVERFLLEGVPAPGLYHCVNSGQGTWQQVAQEAARLLGVAPRLQPVTMEQVRMRAPRPRFCALSNRKLAAAGFTMPAWQDALGRWLATRGQSAA